MKMNGDLKLYFNEVRKCNKCPDRVRIAHPQPGILNKNSKYLFIFQNPAEPKPDKSAEDKILLDKSISDEEFDNVYRDGYLKWGPYNKFIKLIIGDSKDFSVLNAVRCPTINNQFPTCEMIESCNDFLFDGIEYINPKVIICVGHIAIIEIKARGLDKKYPCIFSSHYASLIRKDKTEFDYAINHIKNQIVEIEGEMEEQKGL